MLGSLHTYRRWMKVLLQQEKLSLFGHGCAGAMAGFTVSFVASPIEHVKVLSLHNINLGPSSSPIFRQRSSLLWSTRCIPENRTARSLLY